MLEILKACWKIIKGESFVYKQNISSHVINNGYFIKCNVTKDNMIIKSYLNNCDVDLKTMDIIKVKKQKKPDRIIKVYKQLKVKILKNKKRK